MGGPAAGRTQMGGPATGRPRDPAIDDAVLRATRELLVEHGYADLSFDAVARRAGVSRPALYRRWASKADLVHDAIFRPVDVAPFPDTGDLVADVRACVTATLTLYQRPEVAASINGLIDDLRSDDAADTIRARIEGRVVDAFQQALDRGRERGDVDPVASADTLLTIISGALMWRVVRRTRGLDTFADELTAVVVAGLRPRATSSGERATDTQPAACEARTPG